ncbi:MAG: radical SAM protein [Lachnospiraceae bacterium]|nr:radical SAM protein [Lachnospiraceae bacterium]
MAENIRMDSHKLIYHPREVAKWLDGENVYPIEIEISPSGACNHRCTFCAVDYIGYKPFFLDKDIILRDVSFLSKKGLKSIICSGEGEPLLNKDLPEMANGIKACGVDVAMSSNAALFTREKAEQCMSAFTWIRFSVASLEEESYYAIQRAPKGDFDKVKKNIKDAVSLKREKGYETTLGVQCLLLPGNADQLENMAEQLREIGVDYLTVKPYSQHLHSDNSFFVDYEKMLELESRLNTYSDDDFKVYFRAGAMKKMHHKKCYDRCLGLPFMTHIDSQGNVWPCVAHIGVDAYKFGNIYENTFEEIWEGEQRKKVTDTLYSLDVNQVCREACRLDEINKYLYELKNPGRHVNFI